MLQVTKELLIIQLLSFQKINIGDDLKINDLNKVINNLYDTDFFKDVC